MSNQDQDLCLYEVKGKISIVTLNRPPVHAFNFELMKALNERLEEADKDEKTTVILLKSSGTKVFSAGIDIKMSANASAKELEGIRILGRANNQKLLTMRKPVVCQVQGTAIGFGLELVMACDLRIFANRPIEEMFFRMPEIDLVIYPQTGATILPLLAFGLTYAKNILFTADNFGLEELKKLNVPTRIFSLSELESETMKFTRTLSKRLESFLFLMKSTLNIMNNKFIERWFDLEEECGAIAYKKKSQKELEEFIKDLYRKYP
jgi:enoyl-CoA hydratase/carnithine racemase